MSDDTTVKPVESQEPVKQQSTSKEQYIPFERFNEKVAEVHSLQQQIAELQKQAGGSKTAMEERDAARKELEDFKSSIQAEREWSKIGITDPEDQKIMEMLYNSHDFGTEKKPTRLDYAGGYKENPETVTNKAMRAILGISEGEKAKPAKKWSPGTGKEKTSTPSNGSPDFSQMTQSQWEQFKKDNPEQFQKSKSR